MRNASRQPIHVHEPDRGPLGTLELANGRSESWVMARTGHRSSQMVNRYRRIAELNLCELTSLDQAVPEQAPLRTLGTWAAAHWASSTSTKS